MDEDLLNPSAWIDRINDVEAEVVEQSALRLLVARQEDIKMQELPSIHSRPRINVPASTRWYEGNELFNQEILERSTSADEIHIGGEQEDREDKSRRENLIQETIDILKSWFEEHITHPYPTKEESEIIMDRTVLTRGLVSLSFLCYTASETYLVLALGLVQQRQTSSSSPEPRAEIFSPEPRAKTSSPEPRAETSSGTNAS